MYGVWGPSNNGYPGAFPRGLVAKLKKYEVWGDRRIWLFSGSHKDEGGTTVDIKPELNPDICADCQKLDMVKDETFDFVMLDPPYSEKEAKELYNRLNLFRTFSF